MGMTSTTITASPNTDTGHSRPSTLAALRARLRGTALTPSDDGYDEARRAWNLRAEHRPSVVVLAEDADDVRLAVTFARENSLGVGVMSTGYGTASPVGGDGVLINTSRMRGVQIDPLGRVARVQPGVLWDDLVPAAAAHGLAALTGSSPRVGVVGYTLGGGFGWLGRRYGLAAHSVIRAEVVTANGRLITADRDEHPNLWWGLRGGTGNLGIVTALELALYPVQHVYAGNLYYPLSRASEVLEYFAAWSPTTPNELTAAATFRGFPPFPTIPEPLRGQSLIALRGCYSGDLAAGEKLINAARSALGPAYLDTFGAMPVTTMGSITMDPVDPIAFLGHSELLADLTPETVRALLEVAGPDARSPLLMLEVRQLGGALVGPPGALSPMAHTEAKFSLNAIGITPTPAQDDAVQAHLGKVARTLAPFATGDTYLNFLDLDGAAPERIRAAYSDRDWDRLVRLKGRYDPRNLFRFNRNIPIPA
jgi:FAD/FMN-containing dehydrogenase